MSDNGKPKIGRPPAFDDIVGPKLMRDRIDAYFKRCTEGRKVTIVKKGVPIEITRPIPKTVAGLALALGFTSRQTLLNYTDKQPFLDIITRAKLEIEQDNIEGGMTGEYEPKITGLNLASNYGYSSKETVEHQGRVAVEEIKITLVKPGGEK